MKIIVVAGARPNFIKIAPIIREIKKHPQVKPLLVHTGQHYDDVMSGVFFNNLNIPAPDINLGIGSASHAEQTAKIMVEFEKICVSEKPDLVLVVGDVNSTLACALAASKLRIKIAHVESGLRSFDKSMPEEINRILTDHISDYLFTTESSAYNNLINEGIGKEKIFFVGNVMIDSLVGILKKESNFFKRLNFKDYCLITLHRPSNVDNKTKLKKLLNILNEVNRNMRVVWPIHPRTKKNIEDYGLQSYLKNYTVLNPLGYLDFISLVIRSKFVLTDSGGIQEETSYLGIPCVTLRETTERPITVQRGTNVLANTKKEIKESIDKIIKNKNFYYKKRDIPKWDGKAAKRIVKILLKEFIDAKK